MKSKTIVFMGNQIHSEYSHMITGKDFMHLPNSCYVYYPYSRGVKWFRKDITPVLLEDVPEEIRALALLMS